MGKGVLGESSENEITNHFKRAYPKGLTKHGAKAIVVGGSVERPLFKTLK